MYIVVDAVAAQPVELGLAAVIVMTSLAVLPLRAGIVMVVAVPLAVDKLAGLVADQLAENPFVMLEVVTADEVQ